MTVYIALLRGVNVGGRGRVRMADLRALFVDMGFGDAETYIQSGNVVFSAASRDAGKLSQQIEERVARDLGVSSTVILRSATELERVVADCPYAKSGIEPTKLYVTFLAREPEKAKAEAFDKPAGAPEEFELHARELYVHYPTGYGTSKFGGSYIERRLGVPTTSRNWRVVTALNDMAGTRQR